MVGRGGRGVVVGVALVLAFAACGARHRTLFVSPQLAPGDRELEFQPEGRMVTLANGLRALILPDESSNFVQVDVRYLVGSVEDPTDKAGLAHFVEHLMFLGRPTGPRAPSVGDRLRSLALFYNAYTTQDETHYVALARQSQLDNLLRVEADRMSLSCEHFDSTTFERERQVVLNEGRQRGRRNSLIQELERIWYGADHPYLRAPIGSETEVAGITLDDACEFIDDYYTPANAIVIVSGAVQPVTAERVLQDQFGKLARVEPRRRVAIPMVKFDGGRARLEALTESHLAVIAHPAPVDADREAVYTDLLRFFFEYEAQQRLVQRDGVDGFALFRAGSKRAPLYIAVVVGQSEKAVSAAAEGFFELRKNVLPKLFDQSVVNTVRNAMITAALSRDEQTTNRTDFFADSIQYSRRNTFVAGRLADISSITSAKLAMRSGGFFAPERSHVTLVAPATDATETEVSADGGVQQREIEFDIPTWQLPANKAEAKRPAAVPQQAEPPAARTFSLNNGLTVRLVPDLSYPLIDVRLSLPVGHRHDPPSRPGMAQLAASLLAFDRERPYLPGDAQQLDQVWQMGGFVDADVGDDATVFSIRGLASNADGLLWQLFWRVYAGYYDEDAIETNQRRQAKRRERQDPASQGEDLSVSQRLERALFGPDSVRITATSLQQTFAGVSADGLQQFREQHYRAGKALLVVAGRFDAGDVEARIRRLYGKLAGGLPPNPAAPVPRATVPDRVRRDPAAGSQPVLALGFASAGGEPGARRLVAVEMVRQRMARLREDLGSTYGAQVQSDDRMTSVRVGIAPDRVEQTANAVLDALEVLRAGQALEADFVRARRVVLREALVRRRDSSSVAARLLRARPPVSASDVAAVTLPDVTPILADEFSDERMAAVAVATPDQLGSALARLKLE